MVHKPPKIVLVDDDVDFLEMNKEVLETGGYSVRCFSDPREALKTMREDRPDLVITDVMMDTLDSGFSFSKEIKNDPGLRNIPVIIVSGVSSRRGFDFTPRSREDLAAMCANAYFSKPVVPEELFAKIEELLAGDVEEDPT